MFINVYKTLTTAQYENGSNVTNVMRNKKLTETKKPTLRLAF